VAKARPIAGLSEEDSFRTAAARVVAVRAAELAEHATGVLDVADIERVHDLRVATRRLRAALEVFKPCFPRKRFKRALGDVKALADALGERRDRDLTIAALSAF
jgi:CHAD domain-containing protein